MSKFKLSKKAQAAFDKVVEQFKAGDLSAVVDVATIKLPADAPAANWSLKNQILSCMMTGSLDNRGYKQWQAAGRQVEKGSRAGYIFVPRLVTKEDDEGETYKQLIGWMTIPVFGFDATVPQEGHEDDPFDYTPVDMPPLADVAEDLGIDVTYTPMIEALGSADVDGSAIRLGTEDAKTWFHELAHALDAKLNGKLRGGQHVDQETVAEFTATVLMYLYDLGDRTGNAWQYISHYADDPMTAINEALGRVEQIVGYLSELAPELA